MLRAPTTFLSLVFILGVGGVFAIDFEGGHWRRATPDGPSTFVIPLAVDRNGFYHSNVRMGSDNQKFNFSLSASTGYTIVAGQVCNACGDQNPLYTGANSTSFQSLGANLDTTVDGVNQIFGSLAKENCGLKQSNGSWWQYNNQTVLVAGSVNDGTRDVFTPQISGIFGLSPNARTRSSGDTVLGAWLARNPQAQSVIVGFALRRIGDIINDRADAIFNATTANSTSSDPSASSTSSASSANPSTTQIPSNWVTANAGEMHMLAPDSASYVGSLVSVPTTSYEDTGGPTSGAGGGQQMQAAGWATKLEQWTFLNPAGEQVQGGQGAVAAVDPWYTGIVMPKTECENVYSKIPGAQLVSSETDSQLEWTIPCNTRMNLTITIAGVQFDIDPRDLIEQGETSGAVGKRQNAMCPCSVQGWSDATVPGYMLGSSFMRNAYVVYNASQSNSSQQSSIGFANRFPFNTPTPSQAKRARTIGVTIGSVAGVLILIGGAALAWLWWRSRQKAHLAPSDEFMDDNRGFAYGGYKVSGGGIGQGLLAKARAGGVVIAPGVIFSTSSGIRRQGSDPESYPLMQTPPTTSSPPRAGQPLKTFANQQAQHGPEVHVEDVDQAQEIHGPAHEAYLARLAQHAQGRNVRWSSSTRGGAGGEYERISEQDEGDAHAYGDLARVYEDQPNEGHEAAYDPPRSTVGGSASGRGKTWEQPYYPPAPASGARLSMVVEPITKPVEAAQKEEPSRDRAS